MTKQSRELLASWRRTLGQWIAAAEGGFVTTTGEGENLSMTIAVEHLRDMYRDFGKILGKDLDTMPANIDYFARPVKIY